MQFRKILLEQAKRGVLNEESVNTVVNNYFGDIADSIAKELKKKLGRTPGMTKLEVSKGDERTPYGAVDFISYTRGDIEAKVEIMIFLLNFDKTEVTINTTRADWGTGSEKETRHFRFNADEKEIIDFVLKYVTVQSLDMRR